MSPSEAFNAGTAFARLAGEVQNVEELHRLSAVLTVGTIHAGGSPNAIPEEAAVTGTIRTMTEPQRQMIHTRLRQVANGVATAHDCTVRLEIRKGEPILENDAELAVGIGRHLGAQGYEVREFRSYGSDDFAFYASAARAVMIFTGMPAASGNLHASTFAPDEQAVGRVATAMLTGYLVSAQVLAGGGREAGSQPIRNREAGPPQVTLG